MYFKYKDIDQLKAKGWKKVYHAESQHKEAGMAVKNQSRFQGKEYSKGYYVMKTKTLHLHLEGKKIPNMSQLRPKHQN